jgi:hypothetical protein
MAQGILPFQYEKEQNSVGITGLAGLPLYLDLMHVSRLREVIEHKLGVIGPRRGWSATQHILSVILLNLAGGDCVDDLEILNNDPGFGDVLRQTEVYRLGRRKRRALQRCWRKERRRSVPSPSALRRFLTLFHDEDQEQQREIGKAFIPAPNAMLRRLRNINTEFVSFAHSRQPDITTATLDMDATLVESHKNESFFCYKHFKSYQPLNTWWAEMGMVVHTEFRDGNVPAGYEQLRVFEASLACLPSGVEKVFLRSDTAGYQWDLLRYCAEGKNERYGRIEFAVGCDVTVEFKKAVAEVPQDEWQVLYRMVEGGRQDTGQQWAEVCFVPQGSGFSKKGPAYRFLAIREPTRQLELPGLEAPTLPFPVMSFGTARYKLFGIVTNRTLPGEELIWWSRGRCGKSEQAHAVMKDDLAGGQLPSGLFGANAAWWQMMILALNLNAALKRLALGGSWEAKRMKALRYQLINLPGRVMEHAGRLWIRVAGGSESLRMLLSARSRIRALAHGPPG